MLAGEAPVTMARPRSGPAPHSDGDFLTRIQLALDRTPGQLARALGLPLSHVLDRQGPRARMSEFDLDPFWNLLQTYVDERVAGLLAVKDELDRKARNDRRLRAERHAKVRGT